MPKSPTSSTRFPQSSKSCTDPIVGAILSGWRYDISSISPEMRTDYENHLGECAHCRRRQQVARTIDFLLLAVTMLSFATCGLAVLVLHKFELLAHLPGVVTLHIHQTPIAISLEAVAIAGLVVSTVLMTLVAIATPLTGIIGTHFRQRVSPDLRERLARRHAA